MDCKKRQTDVLLPTLRPFYLTFFLLLLTETKGSVQQ
jgi:hypothetical protein